MGQEESVARSMLTLGSDSITTTPPVWIERCTSLLADAARPDQLSYGWTRQT